jgi:two-component system CheB/CheR fusion protein
MADYEPSAPYWYSFALERLVGVVRELSQARDVSTVTAIVRDAARTLTGADGATFVLRDGAQCYYADETAIAPLWKGKRFPMTACISGWVMLNAQAAVIEDIYSDPRIPAEAYRSTFVKSLAMVPIRRTAPIGAIGNYWASTYRPSSQEVAILQALADTASVALQNAELYATLQLQVQTLEAQQARIRAQHSSLEVFTRALAHDLKEPVRTLVSYSGMLREAAEPERRSAYLSYIHKAAGRLDMLIDAVSQYSWLDEPSHAQRSLCDLNSIVGGIRQNLAALLAERGTILLAGPLPCLHADPAHVTQLLQNLVTNAVLHNADPVTVTIRHRGGGKDPEFSVSDDGAGVDAAQREQIFLPFRRLTHLDGCAGLGLAICHRIARHYGGDIRCQTAPAGGAEFIFSLPGTGRTERDSDFDRND